MRYDLSGPSFHSAKTAAISARRHGEAVAHDAVDLGDHLHVGIFDAVVDGLDEVAGALRPDQRGAGLAVELGRDGGEDVGDPVPGLLLAAGHHRRAVPRALLAAGDADAEEVDAALGIGGDAAAGVAEIGVAGVDQDVAGAEDARPGSRPARRPPRRP